MFVLLFFIITTILSIVVFFSRGTTIQKKPTGFVLLSLIFFLCIICAMRDSTIRDTGDYVDAFIYGDSKMESGFMLLVDVIKKISSSPSFVFASIALISVGLKLVFFRKYSFCFFSTLLVYLSETFISGDFIAIRLALVCSLALWAILFALKKNIFLFVFTILLASSFHITALICFFIWPLVNFKIGLNKFLWFIPISYIIYLTGHSFGYLASFVNIQQIENLYAFYSDETLRESNVVNVFSVMQLVRAFLCLFILWVNRHNSTLNMMESSMLKIYCFGICLFVLLTDIPAFSARIPPLFTIAGVYVVGNLFRYLPNISTLQVKCIIICFAFINVFLDYLYILG